MRLTVIDSTDGNDDHQMSVRGKRMRDHGDFSGKKLFEDADE